MSTNLGSRSFFSGISNTYGHELIDELVIGLSGDPLVPQTNVVDVIKQLLPEKNSFQYY